MNKMKRCEMKKGDIVKIKEEFQDHGEENLTWIILWIDGDRISIEAEIPIPIRPVQVVKTNMVEPVE